MTQPKSQGVGATYSDCIRSMQIVVPIANYILVFVAKYNMFPVLDFELDYHGSLPFK